MKRRIRARSGHTWASLIGQCVAIVVVGALLISAAVETWFSGPDYRAPFDVTQYQQIAKVQK